MKLSSAKWISKQIFELKEKMRTCSDYSYYYECVPESFVIDTENKHVSIKHHGDDFELAFYEISEIKINFDEENDYILEIRRCKEHHIFQFINKKNVLKVCIDMLNQISLLPERHDISESS